MPGRVSPDRLQKGFIVNCIQRAREVIALEIDGLQSVSNGLDDRFEQAVQLLLGCLRANKKIVVTGIGKNLPIGAKISATLASTGATSVLLNPAQAMHGDLGILAEGDALLVLSYSGTSGELLELMPAVHRLGVKIITLTGDPQSALAKYSDVVLGVAVPREACPFNMAPTVSTTATLALGDALAMVLMEARGFRKEDYAQLHPGGAIGRTLLYRVADIMRSGERLATVYMDATVKDAILAMTKARSGSAGVVDEKGRLQGILTDGDLRRAIAVHSDLIHLPIVKVMTKNPITVTPAQLAVDVLRIFEERAIDDLLVVDTDGHLVGAVDIQDLPKLKIM